MQLFFKHLNADDVSSSCGSSSADGLGSALGPDWSSGLDMHGQKQVR